MFDDPSGTVKRSQPVAEFRRRRGRRQTRDQSAKRQEPARTATGGRSR
jgi:hypothetical protein